MMQAGAKPYLENDSKWRYALVEHVLAKVYLQMTDKDARISPLAMVKNIGFLLTNLPVVNRKVEQHLTKAIELAGAVGARGIKAQALLDYGVYHRSKKRAAKARQCISEAIALFKEGSADMYLKQAREILATIADQEDRKGSARNSQS
jgi:L-ribulose-5-phosphate 3-epimerase UlaE